MVTLCSLVLLGVLLMFIFGNTLMRASALQYHSTWEQRALTPVPNATRAQRRLFYRVTSQMRAQCNTNDVVFAPQVLVNAVPYAHSAALLCKQDTVLCDPHVVSNGDREITCMDEHGMKTKLKRRRAPVSINTTCGQTSNFSKHADVCVAWHVIDLLNARW